MHYKAIAPVVGQKPLAQFPPRIKSVTINRLQFGHCLLRMSRFSVVQAMMAFALPAQFLNLFTIFCFNVLFLICCAAHSLTH